MRTESALALFSSVSSGMMALTGIVFAIAFVMVQFSASAYSPRLVVVFGNDPSLYPFRSDSRSAATPWLLTGLRPPYRLTGLRGLI
jgi:predicted membrane protein DUF2254